LHRSLVGETLEQEPVFSLLGPVSDSKSITVHKLEFQLVDPVSIAPVLFLHRSK